ncbi:OsmC family protein [Massilia sp. PWRC2]|uniref:OsmC family protein n=1 Tax=Massilia sp. PWRC2 TaxID=2804626 RepID=UPI003CE8C78E
MKKSASAAWSGGIKEGIGSISTETGVLNKAPYGFKARFGDGPGTNPEELIGAAHAGCFTMALSGVLEKAGLKATSMETTATVTLEKQGEGFAITAVHLALTATIPGATDAAFQAAAADAKANCPVSKLLNTAITLEATLSA